MKKSLAAALLACTAALLGASAASAQPVSSLAGTTWTGKENLGGYGKLTFQFLDNGRVIMIDNDGRTEGKYVQKGNEVLLVFHNDSVAYLGKINGQVITGEAANAKVRWVWEVRRQGGAGMGGQQVIGQGQSVVPPPPPIKN
jgi:opacity protein-like surface antigen